SHEPRSLYGSIISTVDPRAVAAVAALRGTSDDGASAASSSTTIWPGGAGAADIAGATRSNETRRVARRMARGYPVRTDRQAPRNPGSRAPRPPATAGRAGR